MNRIFFQRSDRRPRNLLWPVSDRATPPTVGLLNARRPAVGGVARSETGHNRFLGLLSDR